MKNYTKQELEELADEMAELEQNEKTLKKRKTSSDEENWPTSTRNSRARNRKAYQAARRQKGFGTQGSE